MSHTNFNVPQFFGYEVSITEQLNFRIMELKAKFWEERAYALHREITNMREAVKAYGRVDVSYPDGEKLTLVPHPPEQRAPSESK